MIRINQLKLPVDHGKQDLLKKAAKLLKIPQERIRKLTIRRQSIDARKKGELLYIYAVDVQIDGSEASVAKRAKSPNILTVQEKKYQFPGPEAGAERLSDQACDHRLWSCGTFLRPDACEGRLSACHFRAGRRCGHENKRGETVLGGGNLNPESNVQFGEGEPEPFRRKAQYSGQGRFRQKYRGAENPDRGGGRRVHSLFQQAPRGDGRFKPRR